MDILAPVKSDGNIKSLRRIKSLRQFFQAVFHRGVLRTSDAEEPLSDGDIHYEIPYVFFGIFDGHAGSGCAVAAANELHQVGLRGAVLIMCPPIQW